MKKVILLSAVVAGLALASCGGHGEAEAVVATDSIATDSVVVDSIVETIVDSTLVADTTAVK